MYLQSCSGLLDDFNCSTYGENDDHDIVLLVGWAVLFMWDLLNNVEDLFRGFSSCEGDISDGNSKTGWDAERIWQILLRRTTSFSFLLQLQICRYIHSSHFKKMLWFHDKKCLFLCLFYGFSVIFMKFWQNFILVIFY